MLQYPNNKKFQDSNLKEYMKQIINKFTSVSISAVKL